MIHYLISIIVAVVVFSLVTSPAFAGTGDTLTIFTSHKSIPEGETFVLSGKLKDRNLNPIRNTEIIIWESDRTGNSHVGKTATNSNGEYQISVTAKYWDGVGNAVEIFAFAGGVVSVKSPEITIIIEKPNSYNLGGGSIGISKSSFGSYTNTILSLLVQDSSSQGHINVKPTLTYGTGIKLSNYDVSIYVDKDYKGKVKSDQWLSKIYTGPGHHTIDAYFVETTSNFDNSLRYRASSDTKIYFVKAATTSVGSSGPPSSGSSSGVTSSDSFPMEYVIVGVVIAAAAAGVGIALSKRKKTAPMVYASPANIPVAPAADDTQFWVCPNCGKDTQYKNRKQYCDSCKVYL